MAEAGFKVGEGVGLGNDDDGEDWHPANRIDARTQAAIRIALLLLDKRTD